MLSCQRHVSIVNKIQWGAYSKYACIIISNGFSLHINIKHNI